MPKENKEKLPTNKNESVEFSMGMADNEDLEALQRANAADKRVQKNNK